jgi:hypothetical protein
MKTIIAAGVATFFAVAASAVPAQAGGGITFGFGGGHGHHGHHGGHGGIYLGFAPTGGHGPNYYWKKHVKWCFNHHANYNPDSNTYWTHKGPRYCDSPFM